jgi:rhodanese-related sulfurtransferase
MTTTLTSMIEAARAEVPAVGPAEACEAIHRGDVDLIIDVREPGEFAKGHVPDAVSIPRGILELRADPASPTANEALGSARSGRLLVYCTQAPGFRSLLSAQTLASMGYERVEALDGGLVAWEAAGLPVETLITV